MRMYEFNLLRLRFHRHCGEQSVEILWSMTHCTSTMLLECADPPEQFDHGHKNLPQQPLTCGRAYASEQLHQFITDIQHYR